MDELARVDLVELAPQRVGAPPDARILIGRVGVRPAERFDADQVFVERVPEAAQLHFADVPQEVADLRRADERGAGQHLFERRALVTLGDGVWDVHDQLHRGW